MPRRSFPIFLLAAALLAVLLDTGRARANTTAKPVYVLEIASDDVDEQAEALSAALRARVRSLPGWSLSETSQSLGTLIVALKCPTPPDAPCLQKIAEVLRAERFVWGLMKRTDGQVTIDLHLWEQGKADIAASETYADTLKDPEDDALKGVAARLLSKLTGTPATVAPAATPKRTAGPTGWVTVKVAGAGHGTLLVDGQEKGRFEAGAGRVEVPADGAHVLEVHAPGMRPASQTVRVSPGAESEVRFTLVSEAYVSPSGEGGGRSSTARKVLEWGAIAVGAGLLVAGGVEALLFATGKDDLSDKSNAVAARYGTPGPDGRLHVDDARATCRGRGGDPVCASLEEAYDSQVGHRDRAWIFTGVGAAVAATGVVLLVTDKPSKPSTTTARSPSKGTVKVVPTLGGVGVWGTF